MYYCLIVFQSFQKRLSNVGNILQELDEIPGVLASVYQISDVYRGEVRLKNLIWDFYGTLVDCLSELLNILNRTYKDVNGKTTLTLASQGRYMRTVFFLTRDTSFQEDWQTDSGGRSGKD